MRSVNLLYIIRGEYGKRFFEREYAMGKLQELSVRTINKYIADIRQWLDKEDGIITKENIITYKSFEYYNYAITSANSKIISVN